MYSGSRISALLVWLAILSNLLVRIDVAGGIISLDLKSTDDGQLFYVEIDVGQRDERQRFNLVVSTSAFMTWIPSVKVSRIKGYANKTEGFEPASNKDLYSTGAYYGGYRYTVHNDTWQIGSHLQVERQQFALVYPYGARRHLHDDYNIDGVLGLSGHREQPEGTHYLFRNLFKLGRIQKLQFSLYINKTEGAEGYTPDGHCEPSPAGQLVLGGVDERLFSGHFKFVRMNNRQPVGVLPLSGDCINISSILLDWSRTNEETRSKADIQRLTGDDGRINLHPQHQTLRLDSTSKLFVGPKGLLETIHMDFIGAIRLGLHDLFVFEDCRRDNKPDLVFTVDGVDLIVTPEDYIIHDELDGRDVCLSAFITQKVASSWSFGTRFLRKYYTLFDYENDTVGFAAPK